ncbi:MAG: branched-chain amino acid ABC transporter permease [Aggregatilineales bacterium]
MAEIAARAPILTFGLDFDRLVRAAQRLFAPLVLLHLIWSIALSSGLVTGLAIKLFNINAAQFTVGFWLIQQQALRALVLIIAVGTAIGIGLHRGDQTGYGPRALVGLFGTVVIWMIAERVFFVTSTTPYILTLWGLQLTNGLIAGSLYALIALGYTLVYGILLMINFAHGDVMMVGSYVGYFVLQAFRGSPSLFGPPDAVSFIGTFLMMVIVTLLAMGGSMITGLTIERVAYRPLRRAPRLAPLISAIGMSIFLEQAAQRIFGPGVRAFDTPTLLSGSVILNLGKEFGPPIPISKIGVIVFIAALVLMYGLYSLVQRTRIGRAMRAVAEDKDTAALMGTNVNRVIATTFGLGAALAGAAGVMWGFYTGQTDPFTGFTPGIKAFTAAVLGGIGNIPGAVFGGIFLGLAEALGPYALGIPNQYQNVIAFALLVFILIFRPTGLLGEILAEKKV